MFLGDSIVNGNSTGNGNATNAEENNSQNQCGILFPIAGEVSDTEEYLISLIKTDGKEKNYELIEYINDVNREYAEVLVEQNINGADDTTYVYGAIIGNSSDRLSADRFEGSTGYYLYDPRGSVTGITNEEGQIYQSYRYSAFGEITFGAPAYENEYTYNGESYNPNIESQYLRARYYDVVTATFITEDFYPQDMWSLWNITEPLTLNRYNYCVSSPLNYVDKSGHTALDILMQYVGDIDKSHSIGTWRPDERAGAAKRTSSVYQSLAPYLPVGGVNVALWGGPTIPTEPTPPVEESIQDAEENNSSVDCEVLQIETYDIMDMHMSQEGIEALIYWEILNSYAWDKGYLLLQIIAEDGSVVETIHNYTDLQKAIENGEAVYLKGIKPHNVEDGSLTAGFGDYILGGDIAYYEALGYVFELNDDNERVRSIANSKDPNEEYMPIQISIQKFELDIPEMERAIKQNLSKDLGENETIYVTQRAFDALIMMRYQLGSLGSEGQMLLLTNNQDPEMWKNMLRGKVEEKRIDWEVDTIMFGTDGYLEGDIDLTPLTGVIVEGIIE